MFAQELPSHTFAVAMSLYQIKLWNTTAERPSQDVLAEKAFIRHSKLHFSFPSTAHMHTGSHLHFYYSHQCLLYTSYTSVTHCKTILKPFCCVKPRHNTICHYTDMEHLWSWFCVI